MWLALAWTRTWPQVDGGTLLSLVLLSGSRGERRVYSTMMRCFTRKPLNHGLKKHEPNKTLSL